MASPRGNKGSGNNESRDLWETPQWLFDKLNEQYNFTFDCCADIERTKCKEYSTHLENEQYGIEVAWMNPPFSKSNAMFEHFFKVIKSGVAIFRCDNMETKQWQNTIMKFADWILIPNKRINYEGMSGHGAVFPSALIGYNVDIPKGIEGTILEIKKGDEK